MRRAIALGRARSPVAEIAVAVPPTRGGGTRPAPDPTARTLRQGPAFVAAAPAAGAAVAAMPVAPMPVAANPSERRAVSAQAGQISERIAPEGILPAEIQHTNLPTDLLKNLPTRSPPEAASLPGAVPDQPPAARAEVPLSAGRGPQAAPEPRPPSSSGAWPLRLSAVAAPAAERQPEPDPRHCSLDRTTFERIRAEMLLPEVEAVLGCRGTLSSASTVPGLGEFETFAWSDMARTSAVTMTFRNKRLASKSQRGLNEDRR